MKPISLLLFSVFILSTCSPTLANQTYDGFSQESRATVYAPLPPQVYLPMVKLPAMYYVDNTCAKNGNGQGQTCAGSAGGAGPFNSLANAQAAVVGDNSDGFLLLRKGQTFAGQFTVGAYGTAGHPFTISSYGTGANPVISGGESNIAIYCAGCQYIVLDGLEFTASTGRGANVYIAYPAGHITVRNCYSHHSSSAAILVNNSSNNIIDGNEASWSTNSRRGHGIQIVKADSSQPTTGNIVSNNNVHHNMQYGIVIGAPYSNHLDGSTTKVFGNESYNNSTGIYLIVTDGVEVYENNLHDNGKDCLGIDDCPGEEYGLAIQSGSNNDVHDNMISNSHNTGIGVYGDNGTISGPANGNRLYRNVVYNTTMGRWKRDISWQAVVGQSVGSNNRLDHNVLFGDGENFVIDDSDPNTSGNVAHNNVFYGGRIGVVAWGQTGNAGWTFKNNVFAANRTYSVYAPNAAGGLTLLNNIYYKPNGGTLVVYQAKNYASANIASLDPNARVTDPKFIGTSVWSDFRLQADSPAIDTGVSLGADSSWGLDPNDAIWPPSAADQETYGSGWEIGAFVYIPHLSP